jgi:Protein of unknown function (DUF3995)
MFLQKMQEDIFWFFCSYIYEKLCWKAFHETSLLQFLNTMNNFLQILQSVNTIIFLIISGFHFYWAFGGKFGSQAVIPAIEGKAVFQPPFLATIVVALAMLVGAWLSWIPNENTENKILIYGNLAIGIVFFIRAIGDFKYVGFFKKVKGTLFAENDSRYYSPLCLVVSGIAFFVYWVIR